MKHRIFIITLFFISAIGQAQEKNIKKIAVKGSAEMEVIPDEIYVQITLKEYKSGSKKIVLNSLESELVSAVKKLGIPQESLRVENIYGYNWNWRKNKSEEFLATKSFTLKVNDVKKLNALVTMLDPQGVNNMNINRYDHSKIEEHRKNLKIAAMKAAKMKATYLLEALGEKLGGVLEVTEVEQGGPIQPYKARAYSNVALESDSFSGGYQSNLDFKVIKLRAEMRVVFEIN